MWPSFCFFQGSRQRRALFPQSPRSPRAFSTHARQGVWILVCSAANVHLRSEPPCAWARSGKAHPKCRLGHNTCLGSRGRNWHSSTSLVRPWQKCVRRSHAGTSACPALANVFVKEPRRYFGLPGPGKSVCEGATQVLSEGSLRRLCELRSHAAIFGGFRVAILRFQPYEKLFCGRAQTRVMQVLRIARPWQKCL